MSVPQAKIIPFPAPANVVASKQPRQKEVKTLIVVSNTMAYRGDTGGIALALRTLDPLRMDAFLYRVSTWPGWVVEDLR